MSKSKKSVVIQGPSQIPDEMIADLQAVADEVEAEPDDEGGSGAPVAESKDHNKVVLRLEQEINKRSDIGWGSCDKDVVDDIRLALRDILVSEYGV